MKNEEMYKTPEERTEAFAAFCAHYTSCRGCPAHQECDCRFVWLTLEAEREKLLPCPFCGGNASVIRVLGYSASAVRCDRCHATSGNYDTEKEAIAAWNRRAK